MQLNHSQEDSSRCSDNSSYEEPLSPVSAASSSSRRRQGEVELRDMELPDGHGRDLGGLGHRFLPSEPSKWNVEDVYEFIRSLPGEEERGGRKGLREEGGRMRENHPEEACRGRYGHGEVTPGVVAAVRCPQSWWPRWCGPSADAWSEMSPKLPPMVVGWPWSWWPW